MSGTPANGGLLVDLEADDEIGRERVSPLVGPPFPARQCSLPTAGGRQPCIQQRPVDGARHLRLRVAVAHHQRAMARRLTRSTQLRPLLLSEDQCPHRPRGTQGPRGAVVNRLPTSRRALGAEHRPLDAGEGPAHQRRRAVTAAEVEVHHLLLVTEALGQGAAQRRLPGTVGTDQRHDASFGAPCRKGRAEEVPVARLHLSRAPRRQVDRGATSFARPPEVRQRGTSGAHDVAHVDDRPGGAELEQLVGTVDVSGDERRSGGRGLDQHLRQTLGPAQQHDDVRRDEEVAGVVDVAQQPAVTFDADLAHQRAEPRLLWPRAGHDQEGRGPGGQLQRLLQQDREDEGALALRPGSRRTGSRVDPRAARASRATARRTSSRSTP